MQNVRIPDVVKHYKITNVIGRGSFAVVALAIDQKTSQKVAIKIIDRNTIINYGMLRYLENELRLLSRLNHQSIVKVYDVIYEEDIIMIIMEYLCNKDIQTNLNRGTFFSTKEKTEILYQILEGIEYLHQRGIAHRDIKPENIIFDEKYNPKLVDFGLSKERGNALSSFCGTEYYMAPELLQNEIYDGLKSDIWSFGVTAHLIFTNEYPWDTSRKNKHLFDMKKGILEIKNKITGPMNGIVSKCLEFDPEKRPSAAELLLDIQKLLANSLKIRNTHSNKLSLPKLQSKPITVYASRQSKEFGSFDNLLPKIRVRRVPVHITH